MSHEDIAAWEGFAIALAGASAVLAGLVFVAVSINIDRIVSVPGLPGRPNAWMFLAEVVRHQRHRPVDVS